MFGKFSSLPLIIATSTVIVACDSGSPGGQNTGIDVPGTASAIGSSACSVHSIASAFSSDSYDADHKPSNVIDGSLDQDSRWSSNGTGQQITLDLGSTKSVNTLFTAWYKGNQRDAYFEVHTSSNGSNWSNVLADGVAGGTIDYIAFGLSQTNARYVRITGQGNSSSNWNSLTEVSLAACDQNQPTSPNPAPTNPVPQPPTACNSLDNLYIEKAISDDSHDGNYSPANVIDNDLDPESRWSSFGAGNTVTLDLGQISKVRRIATAWYKANVRQSYFDVATSINGSNWSTVLSNAVVSGTTGMVDMNVRDSDARYVRITGQGNSASQWNSLVEVDVYGCGKEDDNQPSNPPNIPTPNPEPPNNPGGSSESIELIKEYFELEGGSSNLNPYRSNDTLVFDALRAKHVTPNGNGWRHELKVAIPKRRAMDETTESFSARIKSELSDGGKVIVAQYHASGTGTIVKVYVSDTNESGHADSNASNGIFDLYVRVRRQGASREDILDFGTIRSGQSFDLKIINQRGLVTVEVNGESETMRVADSDAAYLKFGNYLQAQDPDTGDDVDDKDDWEDFYNDEGITKSVITFSNIYYSRS